MTIKERLKTVRNKTKLAEAIERQIEGLWNEMYHRKKGSFQEWYVEVKEKLQSKQETLLEEILELRSIVLDKLNGLDESVQALLIDKYFNGMTEEELMNEYSYSRDTIYRKIRKGIELLEKKNKS